MSKEYKHAVYYIQSGHNGPVKIGMAQDVLARMSDLQVGNPKALSVVLEVRVRSKAAARHLESSLHYRFRRFNIRGEWFSRKILAFDIYDTTLPNDSYVRHYNET